MRKTEQTGFQQHLPFTGKLLPNVYAARRDLGISILCPTFIIMYVSCVYVSEDLWSTVKIMKCYGSELHGGFF